MSLTDTAIRNAKPKEKPYKLSDERGLYLLGRIPLRGCIPMLAPSADSQWRLMTREADGLPCPCF